MGRPYSFQGVIVTIGHPSIGVVTTTGEGTGSVSTSYAQDRSSQDLTADGTVITSKILTKNGTVTLNILQTSEVHKWLTALSNYLNDAPAEFYNQINIDIVSTATLEDTSCSGVSIQKIPDSMYQEKVQMVTWTFLAEKISKMGV